MNASDTWIRYTQRQMELHLVEDENFLIALGRAAGKGATNPLQALDMVCAAAIKYWDGGATAKKSARR